MKGPSDCARDSDWMIPLILIHILIFDIFLFFCFLCFFFTFSFVFAFFSFVGAHWQSSFFFLLGVSSLRCLETPKVCRTLVVGLGTYAYPEGH